MENNGGNTKNGKIASYFAFAILGVWVLAFVVGSVTHDYTAFSVSTPVLLIAAGFLFGYKPGGKL